MTRKAKFFSLPWGVVAVVVAATVLLCVGFWLFPWIGDDLGYRQPFRHYFIDGEPATWQQIWEHITFRHFNDNSRWANIAMTLLVLTPGWLRAAIQAVAVGGSLWMPLRLCGQQRSATAAAIWAVAFALLMPWVDQMYVFDLQLNYLCSGTLGLLWTWMWLERKGSTAAFAAISLLVGLWQEATGFPIFAALAALIAINGRVRRDRRSLIAAGCLLVGLAWLYLSPGGLKYRGGHFAFFAGRSSMIYIFTLPTTVYLVCLAVRLLRRRSIGVMHQFLAMSSTVACGVSLMSLYGPRVGWWGTLSALTGLLALLMHSAVGRRRWLKIAAAVLATVAAAHLIAVDFYCWREGRRYDEAIAQYRADRQATIFLPMTLREYAPVYVLQKPYFSIFSHLHHINLISEFYGSGEQPIQVVPEELRSYRRGLGRAIPGTAGLEEYRGYMVAPVSFGKPLVIPMHVSYDPGQHGPVTAMCEVEFTDADGERRAWVTFNTSTLQALGQPIPARVDSLP